VATVALRDETKKDVLLTGLKTQIADLVWNRPDIHDATYVETVELAEECEKVVEIKKIAKNKDLSSAVTVMSEEAEKTKEEISNLKGLIQKLMTTPISQPAVQLEEKTINALNRLTISNTDGKWPSQNRDYASQVNHPTEAEARRLKINEDTTHQLRTEETTKDQIGEIKSNTNLEDVTYATRKATWQDSAGGQNQAHSHNKMHVKTDNKRTDEINLA
jgi:hypothetical protein